MQAINQVITDEYAIYQGDCCELIRGVPGDSIHFGIHSPPFEGLYKFSSSARDLSNSEGEQFWDHYGFLIREMLRVTMPGRIQAVHVMQLPMSKIRHGNIGMRDFRGDVIRAFCNDEVIRLYDAIQAISAKGFRHALEGDEVAAGRCSDLVNRLREEQDSAADGGFVFHSETCIWKDPVVAQQRTKSIRLLHKQVEKDSTISGQGLADYIVAFRKPGDNPEPVAGKLMEYVGKGKEPADVESRIASGKSPEDARKWYSIEVWQRYASPVWMDIDQTRTLQHRAGRDDKDEVHISPLQLDVIERCIHLWSNPGDTVLTPFLGIGSEVYGAVEMGRKGIGFELKPSYFAQAVKNLEAAKRRQGGLFGAVA